MERFQPAIINSGSGTFQISANGLKSILIPQTITVVTSSYTSYRGSLSGFSDITSGMNVRIVGFLVKDPATGSTLLLAHYIDELR